MDKRPLIILASVMIIALGAYMIVRYAEEQKMIRAEQAEETAIRDVVEGLGRKLQMVPLMAEKEMTAQSMRENYQEFLSAGLLEEWIQDPSKALGREVSSPWPERIDILSMEEVKDGEYRVRGKIIEVTSLEIAEGTEAAAAKRSIELIVERAGDTWRITGTIVGGYDDPGTVGGAQDGVSATSTSTGIQGIVMRGPTCPVVIAGSGDECADKPFATTLSVRSVSDGAEVRQFASDTEGRFSVALAPGRYVIASLQESAFPICREEVEVRSDGFTAVAVNCDSGIR